MNGLWDDLFMSVIEDDVLVLREEGGVSLLVAQKFLEMVVFEGLVVLLEVGPRMALHCFKQDMIIWYDKGNIINLGMVEGRQTAEMGLDVR